MAACCDSAPPARCAMGRAGLPPWLARRIAVCRALLFPAGSAESATAWRSARLEDFGCPAVKWEDFRAKLAGRNTRALLVARYNRLILEWYAPGHNPSRRQATASVAKGLVGGLSLALAMQQGRIRLEDRASTFIPAWRHDANKREITILQLATHSSGIEDADIPGVPHEKLPGWKGDFWKRVPDPFTVAVHQAPLLFPPGSKYHYSNTGMAALAYAVTASLRDTAQPDLHSLLKQRFYDPIGLDPVDWSIGYGRPYVVDGLKLYANWGGGSFTPRAMARIAQVLLQHGRWIETTPLRRNIVERLTRPAGGAIPDRARAPYTPLSGLGWYSNADGVWPGVPKDAFAAAGAGHQLVVAIPSLHLVAVRSGGALRGSQWRDDFWEAAYQDFLQPLAAVAGACTDASPYPPSPVIGGIDFAPPETIQRAADDSDNWPLTWADDGDLYTSYGDGRGFLPFVERKLSMGYARITGGGADFRGFNIRSADGERTGDGPRGMKASGMLMVDGVLYMWVRNAGNSQLWWSEDRARSWRQGFRFDVSFGSPAFLNYGRNYEGSRDGYVYTYSQDGPSAYDQDDSLVLARVPQGRIRERGAYEFFVRMDNGTPVWTSDIAARGPVLRLPGRCQRVDAVYHPGLQRYLLALGYNHLSGWGIFDAPQPWGPWTTAFHTSQWDLPATHGYRLPSKWMESGSPEMWLVFSGATGPKPHYDAFCVRKMTLRLR